MPAQDAVASRPRPPRVHATYWPSEGHAGGPRPASPVRSSTVVEPESMLGAHGARPMGRAVKQTSAFAVGAH